MTFPSDKLWDPATISPEQLQEYRSAAELAWGDDTRHEAYAGHPQPSAGQCWVTSRWLANKLGGRVARSAGHYVWLSPDSSHVVDLTGDQLAYKPEDLSHEGIKLDEDDTGLHYAPHQLTYRPGPAVYVAADHPLYPDLEPVEAESNERSRRFEERADQALQGLRTGRTADLIGADPYPAEEPQAASDYDHSVLMEAPLHDEPDAEPDEGEYNFVYANGQVHVAPADKFEQSDLAGHAGVNDEHQGPTAAGRVVVNGGTATWQVDGNLGLRAFHRILKDYTDQVGWRWGGMTSLDGEPINDEFAPKKSMYYSWDTVTGHLLMSERIAAFLPRPKREDPEDQVRIGRIEIQGKTARVAEREEEPRDILREWAEDYGYKLAEYPGGGNMNDKVKRHETLETEDYSDPNPVQRERPFFPSPPDERQPGGVFKCPHDGEIFPSFYLYQRHLDEEHPAQDFGDQQSGGFPELDPDAVAPPHFHEMRPETFPVSSFTQAARVPGFKLYSKLWGFDNDEHTHYVAFVDGSPVGYATVRRNGPGRVLAGRDRGTTLVLVQSAFPGRGIGTSLIRRLQVHYPEIVTKTATPSGERLLQRTGFVNVDGSTWRWSKDGEAADMIEAPIPFIYDIEEDHVIAGQPGQKMSDIPGSFNPSGIQEGVYEPGGKIVLKNLTNMFVTVRHLLDLWKWTPGLRGLKVKGVDLEDDAGRRQKLAAQDDATVGRRVAMMARTDPAAAGAIDALTQAGGQPYIVGGAVRDEFLGKIPHDFDLLVTGLDPDTADATLRALPGHVDLTGKKFGVFRYKAGAHEVEVALPRVDTSTGPQRRDFDAVVDPNRSVEDDLVRRDYTVNSVAVDANSGKVVDPYGGISDIKAGKLRTTHPSSFQEDPTRILRGLTAHAKHGFEPDEQTRSEMREHAPQISAESQELVLNELEKIFRTQDPAKAIGLAHDTGVLGYVFPELESMWAEDQNNPHHDLPKGPHSLAVLRNAQRLRGDPDFRLAALLHDVGKGVTQETDEDGISHFPRHDEVGAEMVNNRLRQLKYPNDRRQRIVGLVKHHMWPSFDSPRGARRFLNRVGDHADDLMSLREADFSGKRGLVDDADRQALAKAKSLVGLVRAQEQATTTKDLAINGQDLINLGLQPGPQFGTILQTLTNEVIDDPEKNDRTYLLQRAQELAS